MFNNENGCFNGLQMENSPIFVTGESYAGKWVPSFSKILHDKSQNSESPLRVKLGGAALGDPFTDPKSILLKMPEFAYNYGIITRPNRDRLQKIAEEGASMID